MSESQTCTRELHKKLNSFQHDVVHQGGGQYLVSACAGCLSGDTIIEINRGSNSFKIRLDDLVYKFNGGISMSGAYNHVPLSWDLTIPTNIRARDTDGYVRLFKLKAAYVSGSKDTYTLTTKSGNTIRATKDHKFLTSLGWKPLANLSISDWLYVLKPLDVKDTPLKKKPNYLQTSGMYSHPHRCHRGSGRYSVATHRLVVEAALNGVEYVDYIIRFATKNISHPDTIFLDPEKVYVHHLDENTENNAIENLQILPAKTHAKLHGVNDGWKHVTQSTYLDEIVSIQPYGNEITYDLELETEPHNFVANNFIVHNSGKTTTLVDRIEQLIVDGANPNDIGVFTFAKDAANELQKRLKALDLKDVTASTLHSLCYSILREDGKHIGGDFLIDDKSLTFYQTKDFISKMFRGVGLDAQIAEALFGLAKAYCLSAHPVNQDQDKEPIIELFKKVGEKPWLADAYYNLFKEVEQWKVNKRLIDYSDQLYLAWLLLVDNADIQDKWASKFQYLLIDEGQDSSTVQNAIGLMLSKKFNNIMIVGDVLQSLYQWRGSNPEEFVNFSKKFKTFTLPVNYRSTKEICASATRLTKDLHWNITGETLAHDAAPTNVKSLLATEYETPEDEANGIAEEIQKLAADGTQYKDIAVLYRLVTLLAPIENALAQRKIPYVVWSGYTFYDRKEIKDVLAYLYTISMRDPTEQWVKRAINVPFRYISKQYIQTVEDVALSNKYSFIDALGQYKSPRENQNTSVRKFIDLLFRMNQMYSAKSTPTEILNLMLKETFYLRSLSQEEGSEGPDPESGKSSHVHQLLKIAQGFKTVDSFLDYVSNTEMLLKESRKRRNSNAVVLSTIHRSKGLQWDAIFAPGWNEGLLPHLRNPSQDEELRIAYVCLTRAAKLFRCSWTRNQITQGGARQLPMSKFIERAGIPMVKLPTKPKPRLDVVQWLKEHQEFGEG